MTVVAHKAVPKFFYRLFLTHSCYLQPTASMKAVGRLLPQLIIPALQILLHELLLLTFSRLLLSLPLSSFCRVDLPLPGEPSSRVIRPWQNSAIQHRLLRQAASAWLQDRCMRQGGEPILSMHTPCQHLQASVQ